MQTHNLFNQVRSLRRTTPFALTLLVNIVLHMDQFPSAVTQLRPPAPSTFWQVWMQVEDWKRNAAMSILPRPEASLFDQFLYRHAKGLCKFRNRRKGRICFPIFDVANEPLMSSQFPRNLSLQQTFSRSDTFEIFTKSLSFIFHLPKVYLHIVISTMGYDIL